MHSLPYLNGTVMVCKDYYKVMQTSGSQTDILLPAHNI